MAFRGRGRGRGFGGRDFSYAKQEPFVLFPDIELPNRLDVPLETDLARRNFNLRRFFQTSPYHLEETSTEKEDDVDIERFSDKVNKKSRFDRESLLGSGYLKLEPGYFPLELVRGTKYRTKRKVQWNPKQDLKLDLLEDLEKKHENGAAKEKKENDGEDEEEDEEDVEEDEDEVDTDDDYAQGENFDDDEDDYNINDDGDDEAAM